MIRKIALHSVPRSGSTWLGEILNSSLKVKYAFQPLFSYALKEYLSESSSRADIDAFYDALLQTKDEFIDQAIEREAGTLARFEKDPQLTHVAYKEVRYHHILENLLEEDEGMKVVLLVRNPVEVMDSWVGAPREFDPGWSVDEQLLDGAAKNGGRPEEFFGLEKWIEATRLFHALSGRFPERTFLVRYSDLKSDPERLARRLFAFCDLDVGPQTLSFLSRSTSTAIKDTYSVFRGTEEKRITNLTMKQVALIRGIIADAGLSDYLI